MRLCDETSHETYVELFLLTHKCTLDELFAPWMPWMLLEIAIFRAIIWLLWPTPFLENIGIFAHCAFIILLERCAEISKQQYSHSMPP